MCLAWPAEKPTQRAKEHREGREPSKVFYASFAVNGLLYASRPTAADFVAVRAVRDKLTSLPAVELIRQADLVPALRSIGLSVRARR